MAGNPKLQVHRKDMSDLIQGNMYAKFSMQTICINSKVTCLYKHNSDVTGLCQKSGDKQWQ